MRRSALAATFYVVSMLSLAGLSIRGSDASRACPDLDAQIAEMKEHLEDEERWRVFFDNQMLYPSFRQMPWGEIDVKQATDLQVEISWAHDIDLKKLAESNGTVEEKQKMVAEIKEKIRTIREMRRQYVRDVYLKVYKIPAEDPAYGVL